MIKEIFGRPSVGETETLISGKTESGFLGENKEILGPELFLGDLSWEPWVLQRSILILKETGFEKPYLAKGQRNPDQRTARMDTKPYEVFLETREPISQQRYCWGKEVGGTNVAWDLAYMDF